MYSSFQLAIKYLRYYRTASNGRGHGMHSPFVFDFILHVLNNRKGYTPPAEVEALRKRLLADEQAVPIIELGAGSRSGQAAERKVRDIARSAVKPPKYGQLLHRLVRHYQPPVVLELGTSLGVTTAYLASAQQAGKVVTVEGNPAIAALATDHFRQLRLRNVTSLLGPFDELLPGLLLSEPRIDLAFIDGNHRYAPTLRYFQQLLPHLTETSILVFDDIHWSVEMEQAWREIQQHPSVTCTLDLFFLGFVFLRPEFRVPRHFEIRF